MLVGNPWAFLTGITKTLRDPPDIASLEPGGSPLAEDEVGTLDQGVLLPTLGLMIATVARSPTKKPDEKAPVHHSALLWRGRGPTFVMRCRELLGLIQLDAYIRGGCYANLAAASSPNSTQDVITYTTVILSTP
jgi:hypothetical protein